MSVNSSILSIVKPPKPMEAILSDMLPYKLKRYGAYRVLTGIGVNEGGEITVTDVNKFIKQSYNLWYQYITSLNENNITNTKMANAVKEIKSNPQYHPSKMSENACRRFVFEDYDKLFKGCGVRPMHAQGKSDPVEDDYLFEDFIHFYPLRSPSKPELRLYLNIKPKNRVELAIKLQQACVANGLRPYGKFWTGEDRNDGFLIYTTYDVVNKMVEIIEDVKNKNPHLFEGVTVPNPFLGSINGYIGIGEDPQYKHSSFNLERGEAIDELFQDLISEEYKRIGNYTGRINTSEGESLDLRAYLKYRIKKSFMETVTKNYHESIRGICPKSVKPSQFDNYKAAQAVIYKKLTQEGLTNGIVQQIDDMVDNIINKLKEGKRPTLYYVRIKTNRKEFCYNGNPEINLLVLQQKGYLEHLIEIDYDIDEKLQDVFGVEQSIKKQITREVAKPYFDKHHVMYDRPYMNIESGIRVSQPI